VDVSKKSPPTGNLVWDILGDNFALAGLAIDSQKLLKPIEAYRIAARKAKMEDRRTIMKQ
jgi:hypothetical protein